VEWCRLYARLPDDIAIQRAGERAAWLFVLGMCYCTSEESDGFIPVTQLPRFGLPQTSARVHALVREGLWTKADRGYTVTRWRDLQTPTDRIERKRKADRERQAAKREEERRALHNGDVAHDTSATSQESRVTEESRYTPPNPPAPRGGTSRCQKHQARPKSWCPDCSLPPLAPVPEHCGKCNPSRRLEDEGGNDIGPCPNCHPSTVRQP